MIDQPTIVQTEALTAAVIRFTIPRDEIREVMGPAIQEVIEVAQAQGIGPSGPVFSHHFKMEPEIFDFEVGVPLSAPLKPTGRVQASELPAAKVIRSVYTGPYEGLGDAWGEFMDMIAAEGHSLTPNLWECYLTNPETQPDSNTWRTELNRPLAS